MQVGGFTQHWKCPIGVTRHFISLKDACVSRSRLTNTVVWDYNNLQIAPAHMNVGALWSMTRLISHVVLRVKMMTIRGTSAPRCLTTNTSFSRARRRVKGRHSVDKCPKIRLLVSPRDGCAAKYQRAPISSYNDRSQPTGSGIFCACERCSEICPQTSQATFKPWIRSSPTGYKVSLVVKVTYGDASRGRLFAPACECVCVCPMCV